MALRHGITTRHYNMALQHTDRNLCTPLARLTRELEAFMRVSLPIAALLTVVIVAAPVASAPAQQTSNSHQWHGTVPQGSAIEIKGVNGEIRAMASTGAEVEVAAVMRGRRSDPAEVRIDVVQHADGVTICAVYPSPDSRPNECQPGDGGRMNTRNNDVHVSFTVRVPPGVRFIGRTVNGDVTADSLGGPVSLRTVNGDTTFSTSSFGEASTVNGSVRGTMGNGQWNEPLEFHTVNGGISLDLPADTSADVKAATVNGSITTDFPITVSGRVQRNRLNGTIGNGGRALELETVNGSITLRRR
jgi:Putative adhesin